MNTEPTRFTDTAPRHRRPAPRAVARAGQFLAPAWRAARELARRAPLTLLLPLLLLGALGACTDHDLPTGPTPGAPSMLAVASPNSFTQVGTAFMNSCAVRGDGVVECWGWNEYGQAPATKTAGIGLTFTQVGGGVYHNCALRSDGVAECWGDMDSEPLGTRSAAIGTFTQVSAGSYHNCAVRSDGVVECWGGLPAAGNKAAADGKTFTQVSAGEHHNCALRSDGVVECWGDNDHLEAPATKTAASGTFTQVDVGTTSTCALRGDGKVECWGDPYRWWSDEEFVTMEAASGTFTQVSAGHWHACAVNSDGVVECWGDNGNGQAPATRSALSGTFTQVSAYWGHTCALRSDGVVECWGDNTAGRAPATKTATGTTAVTVLPTATFSAPASVQAGQSFTLALSDAQVPGHPSATIFTYAFDCGDGAGYGSFSTSSSVSCPTSTAGSRSVKGTVRDQDGDQTGYTAMVEVTAAPGGFTFSGFFSPVANLPAVNVAKAGSAIPVKFSLGGDQGLSIFASGSPGSQQTACDALAPQGPVQETVNAGGSSLSYDAARDRYIYVWKSDKTWAGTCRTLSLTFTDGTTRVASFRFD
jgi:alpha-tubulin suppressor-like RCC1 family protein